MDRELRHLQDVISIIAYSSDLFADDFAASHLSVNPLFKGEDLGLAIRDLAGQFILNTCVIDNQTSLVREAFGGAPSDLNDGRSVVSDLIEEPVSGASLLTIDVLVRREGGASYILSLCALPRIPATNMPQTEKSFVSDLRGSPASAYQASSRVHLAGWTVAIDVPGAIFSGPFRRSLLVLLVAGGGTLALVLVLAINVGRRIAGPIAKLTELARTLGVGGKVDPPVTGINEADLVARALCSTSRDLSRRTQELTETIAALRISETRLRQASGDLQQALDQRTELLNRMVSAQESERQRIARELHDHFEQYFVAMLLGLNAAEKAWSRGDKGHQGIAELKEITLSVSRDVHQLSLELRPTALDDFGLEAAMANYLEKWRERFSLDVDFVGNLRGRRLPPPIEITLYRVLQEAMTNVAKHANAAKISVALEADPAEVRLIVEDDGTGFDKETAAAPGGPANGFGLLGIRERLAAVGGSLIIETAPKRGTALFCQIPA